MSELVANPPADPADLLRFYEKTKFTENGCWYWQANRNPRGGYGRFRLNGRLHLAHRVAYQWMVGPIPRHLQLDHLCRRPDCVNPFHLELVTAAENIRRGTQGDDQRAKTHCPRGHAYDEANTYVNPRGQRMCRACGRERMRARRAT